MASFLNDYFVFYYDPAYNGKERLKTKFVFFLIKVDVKPTFPLVVTYRKYKVHGECWLFLGLPT